MKVTISPRKLDTDSVDSNDMEDLSNFRAAHHPERFFDMIINHAVIEFTGIVEKYRNKMFIYANLDQVIFNVTEVIEIPNMPGFEIDTIPDVFFDTMQDTYKKGITIDVIQFKFKGKFVANYSKELNLLCTTDWTHEYYEGGRADCSVVRKIAGYVFTSIIPKLKVVKVVEEEEGIMPSMGHDIELEMCNLRGRTINASGVIVDRGGRLGTDGCGQQVEIRPKPSKNVDEVIEDTKKILETMVSEYRGYRLSSAGDRFPIGGHMHVGIGKPLSPPQNMLELFDIFLGKPTQICNGKARGHYAQLSAYESKPWGFEYRSVPGAVADSPEVLRICMKCMQNLVNTYTKYKDIEIEDPPSKEDYIKYCKLTEEEYNTFRAFIDGYAAMKKTNVLKNWLKNDCKVKSTTPLATVNLADEWEPWIKSELSTQLNTILREQDANITIRIYGIHQNRGFTAGFDMGLKDTAGRPIPTTIEARFNVNMVSAGNEEKFNRVSFGLPWVLRTNREMFTNNRSNIVSAILENIRPYIEPRQDTEIEYLGVIRCA